MAVMRRLQNLRYRSGKRGGKPGGRRAAGWGVPRRLDQEESVPLLTIAPHAWISLGGTQGGKTQVTNLRYPENIAG